TADTGPLPALQPFFEGVDLLIAEATDLERGQTAGVAGHLTAKEAGELAVAAGAKSLLITHIWEEHGFDRSLADAAAAFHGLVYRAYPGLKLSIPGKSA
ncbi:MAG: MBL fold metallo-hydrolase, partial [Thermomicrobiales bacterium]